MNPIIYRIINVLCVALSASCIFVSLIAFSYWLLAAAASLEALFLAFCCFTIGAGWFFVGEQMTKTANLYEELRIHEDWKRKEGFENV